MLHHSKRPSSLYTSFPWCIVCPPKTPNPKPYPKTLKQPPFSKPKPKPTHTLLSSILCKSQRWWQVLHQGGVVQSSPNAPSPPSLLLPSQLTTTTTTFPLLFKPNTCTIHQPHLPTLSRMETLRTHFFFLKTEPFISNQPLNFNTSSPALAKYAAIANYESETSSSSLSLKADEGLEAAKLGISQEIISVLAKRGITKLFPIQVSLALTLYLFSLFLLWVSFNFQ